MLQGQHDRDPDNYATGPDTAADRRCRRPGHVREHGDAQSQLFFFSSRSRHPRCSRDWSSDVCSSDLLLSFTASKLWELRDRHFKQLPRKAYDAMGGVGGALAKHAEDTMTQFTAEEQKLVREAFRHLVTAEGTRAVLTRAELRQVLGATTAG